MKKQLPKSKLALTTTFLFCLLFTAYGQTPISNGGFETWEDVFILSVPNDWEVEKDHEIGSSCTSRITTESTEGSSSLRLTTVNNPDETEPYLGYAVLGEVGEEGPTGGIAWTEAVDELHFDAKYSTEGSDAALAMVQVFNASGDVIGGGSQTYTGVQDPTNNWNSETVVLSYTGTPAAIMVGFVSSNYADEANITAGSWIQIDNVRLFNGGVEVSTPLPNFSFENWSDFIINDPVAWSSSNMELSEDGIANVTQSTNAVEGTYAARLENIQMSDYVMTGALTYGEIPWEGTTAYSDKPEFLIGYYNYTPTGGDQGRIHVSFEDASDNPLGNALFDFGATVGYKSFVLPIGYWSTDPTDHVLLGISAGETPVAGSSLLVDNFQFVNGYNVNFTVQDDATSPNFLENAVIAIESYQGDPLTTDVNGIKSVKLPDGTYDITVSLTGYDDYTGQITINGADIIETITMSVATGIETSSADLVSVFPNPASNKIFVRTTQKIEQVTLTNLSGQIVLNMTNPASEEEISVGHLPTGQYILVIEMGNETIKKSVILSR